MSRSVYVGRDSRGYVSTDKSAVVWRTEVMTDDMNRTVTGLVEVLRETEGQMVADGIDPEVIRVVLDYDREPDYGEDRINPKIVMTGRRPATKAEVEAEQERQTQAKRAAKADEAARLRARLAEIERTGR